MGAHGGAGGVDDQDVPGAQRQQGGGVLAEVGDRGMPGTARADRAGDVRPWARTVEGGPHSQTVAGANARLGGSAIGGLADSALDSGR